MVAGRRRCRRPVAWKRTGRERRRIEGHRAETTAAASTCARGPAGVTREEHPGNTLRLPSSTLDSEADAGEQVVILRWPEESERLARLRAARVSRLLLIPPHAAVPPGGDCEEDWIRLPADDRDVRARLGALARRAERHHAQRPFLDGHGLLTLGAGSIVLSPLAASLAAVLVEHFGQTVPRAALLAVWPDERVTGNALRIAILRLRRRVATLGLEVRTIPGHGYRLQRAGR